MFPINHVAGDDGGSKLSAMPREVLTSVMNNHPFQISLVQYRTYIGP
jgi:hypothetical protein